MTDGARRVNGEVILTVRNRHFASCGRPNAIEAGLDRPYVGYFENREGEQFVFERLGGKGILRGGDLDWRHEYVVQPNGSVTAMVLDDDERAWLRTCMRAAGLAEGKE